MTRKITTQFLARRAWRLRGTQEGERLASQVLRRRAQVEETGGFGIMVGNSFMIEDKVADNPDGYSAEFPDWVQDGRITDDGWAQLNRDIDIGERNALQWLRKTFNNARDEGHDDESLVGTVWFDNTNPDQVDWLREGLDDVISSGKGNLPIDHTKGMSDFGAAILDCDITFYGIEEEQLDPASALE